MKPNKLVLAEYSGNELTESFTPSYEIIQESRGEGKPARIKMKGHFANCDEATLNKRLYKKDLWEREINKLKPRMESRNLFGELDHPSDGKTLMTRVSHVITDMHIEGNKVVGEAEILPTPSGKILQALLESNCKVGVSSRGYGSVLEDAQGNLVVQDDFSLATFDAVGDPAAGAFPNAVFEAREFVQKIESLTESEKADLSGEFLNQLGEAVTEEAPVLTESAPVETAKEEPAAPVVETPVVEQKEPCGVCGKTDYVDIRGKCCDKCAFERKESLEKEMEVIKENSSKGVLEAIEKAKAELSESITQKLLSDPAVAGAKSALNAIKEAILPFVLPEEAAAIVNAMKEEHIAKVTALESEKATALSSLEAANKKVDELSSLNIKLESAVKKFGYALFLERLVAGNEDAITIKKMVGDVTLFESTAAIQERVNTLSEFLATKKAQVVKLNENTISSERQVIAEAQKELSEVVATVSEQLSRSKELTRSLSEQVAALQNENASLKHSVTKQATNDKYKKYVLEQTKNNPNKDKILQVLEKSNVNSTEDVDTIIEVFSPVKQQVSSVDDVKNRIRDRKGSGGISQTFDDISESTQTVSRNVDGIDISTIKNIVNLATRK